MQEQHQRISQMQSTCDIINNLGGIKQYNIQSDKLGYDWFCTEINSTVVKKEYIAQENPTGTSTNPIQWTETTPCITNAYYIYNNVYKVWTGGPKDSASWDDPDFVEMEL